MSYILEQCQRCRSLGGMAFDVPLFGAYHAVLCRQHFREWSDSAMANPEWLSIGAIKARLDAAIASGDSDSAERHQREGAVLFSRLYATAKAWAEADPEPEKAANGSE